MNIDLCGCEDAEWRVLDARRSATWSWRQRRRVFTRIVRFERAHLDALPLLFPLCLGEPGRYSLQNGLILPVQPTVLPSMKPGTQLGVKTASPQSCVPPRLKRGMASPDDRSGADWGYSPQWLTAEASLVECPMLRDHNSKPRG